MNNAPQTPLSDLKDLRAELLSGLDYFKKFLRNPVESLKSVPDWSWPALIIIISVVAIFLGALTGFGSIRFSPFKISVTSLIAGFFVSPISALIVTGILSGLTYYTALFIYRTELNFKKIMSLVFLSCLPWLVIAPALDYLPILNPVAVILCSLIAIVAFTENTTLSRRQIFRMVGTLTTIFIIFWVINMINWSGNSSKNYRQIPSESLDILERELKGTSN